MKKMIFAGLFTALVSISGCGFSNVSAIEIIVMEDLGDGQQSPSRTLITEDFMRLDGGNAEDDFILLDRKNNQIYAVNNSDHTIVKLSERDTDIESPIELNWESDITTNHDFETKTFLKQPVKKYTINVDGEQCFVAYYIDDFLIDAAKAEQQFLNIIASDHRRILSSVPADQLDACDLVINVFHPGTHLQHGYPLGVSNGLSYRRVIQSYDEDASVDKSLFQLPEDYKEFTPEMIQPIVGG